MTAKELEKAWREVDFEVTNAYCVSRVRERLDCENCPFRTKDTISVDGLATTCLLIAYADAVSALVRQKREKEEAE